MSVPGPADVSSTIGSHVFARPEFYGHDEPHSQLVAHKQQIWLTNIYAAGSVLQQPCTWDVREKSNEESVELNENSIGLLRLIVSSNLLMDNR